MYACVQEHLKKHLVLEVEIGDMFLRWYWQELWVFGACVSAKLQIITWHCDREWLCLVKQFF